MKILVGFYSGEDSFYDRVVKWWTNSRYCHAELIMPDGKTWISIRPGQKDFPTQILKKEKTEYDPAKWTFIEFDITEEQRAQILEFYEMTKGCKYDWFGMIMSHLLPWRVKRQGRWYCSEWVAYALRISNVLDWRNVRIYRQPRLSPGWLHNVCASSPRSVVL